MNRRTMFSSIAVMVSMFCIAASARADLFSKWRPDDETRVYDSETRQPIEGVYVMAEYRESGSYLLGHSASWCVRTAGAYTDKQGKATFPRSAEGRPLFQPIKPGYRYDPKTTVEEDRRHGRTPGDNPEITYMAKQDMKDFQSTSYVKCARARTLQDVEANIEYVRLLIEEDRLYRPGRPATDSLYKTIEDLKKLPRN